jgi:hypothetical protein
LIDYRVRTGYAYLRFVAILLNVFQVNKAALGDIVKVDGDVIHHDLELAMILDPQDLVLGLDADSRKDHPLEVDHQGVRGDLKALRRIVPEHEVSKVSDIEFHFYYNSHSHRLLKGVLGFWGFGV